MCHNFLTLNLLLCIIIFTLIQIKYLQSLRNTFMQANISSLNHDSNIHDQKNLYLPFIYSSIINHESKYPSSSRHRRLQLRNRSDSRVSIHGYLVAKERRCSPGHRICPRPADVHALHASCQAQQVLGPTRSGYRPTSSAKNLAKDSSSIGVHAIVPETERRKPKRHTASDSSFERKAKVDSAVQ